jgi:hypothetical protein
LPYDRPDDHAPGLVSTTDYEEYGYDAWTGAYNVSRPYAVNGLNQYTGAGPATFACDSNDKSRRRRSPA